MTNYRDGEVHKVGPIRLRYAGENAAGQEQAECWIRTEGDTKFFLDFLYAEALATALEPFPDLFTATESDKSAPDRKGNRRGFLRLRASSDKAKHGELAATGQRRTVNEVYQLSRLIMNAGPGEEVLPVNPSDEGRRDYRRSGLRLEGSYRATARTRHDFIEYGIARRVELLEGKDAAEANRRELWGRFGVADADLGAPGTFTWEEELEGEPT